jgi:uncharacterized phage protein (TIGR01671 family)
MSRIIKFRVWDEKYNCWEKQRIEFYPNTEILKQGRILSQFIGVQDADGIDMYEGDIVCALSSDNKYNSIIEWCDSQARFGFVSIRCNNMSFSYDLSVGCSKWKVVGNIFENPELVEKNK